MIARLYSVSTDHSKTPPITWRRGKTSLVIDAISLLRIPIRISVSAHHQTSEAYHSCSGN